MKKTLCLVAVLALFISLFCVVSVASAAVDPVRPWPSIVVDLDTGAFKAYYNTGADYTGFGTSGVALAKNTPRIYPLYNEYCSSIAVYAISSGSGSLKVYFNNDYVGEIAAQMSVCDDSVAAWVNYTEQTGSIYVYDYSNVSGTGYLYLRSDAGDKDLITATASPASFPQGACPGEFMVTLRAKRTATLQASKLTKGYYKVAGQDIPIVWNTTAMKMQSGSDIAVKPMPAAVTTLNQLPPCAANYIFLSFDPYQKLTIPKNAPNAMSNAVDNIDYYAFGSLYATFAVTGNGSVPSTGDSTPIALLAGLMAIAAVAVVLVLRRKHAAA